MGAHPTLEHRRVLRHPAGFRPFRGTDLFARIGGQRTVDKLVDALYDRFAEDDLLRPMFSRDLARERGNQKRFFGEWLGGEPRYSDSAWAGVHHRHDDLPITRALAGRWLAHFQRALESAVARADDRAAIFEQARLLAFALVNEKSAPPSRHRSKDVAWCGVEARTVKGAVDLAYRGDTRGLQSAIVEAPDLLRRATLAAALMQTAALAGRPAIIELLLERGADIDLPHYLPIRFAMGFERVLFVTPCAAARLERRGKVEAFLCERGAKDDVFTAAFLGDTSALGAMLAADPTLAATFDPAVDVLDITPVHHAVAGGHVDALRSLLEHPGAVGPSGARALRGAAERNDCAMVELLLEHGADAKAMGPGRWVLHPEIAPLLAAAGASVGSSGEWIGRACTGNQGRKDDPDYVRALLRHGARATDRRDGGATALHYAAKAGFLSTIALLLEEGADPAARDAEGKTPRDWLEHSAKSVDKDAVRRLLAKRRSSFATSATETALDPPAPSGALRATRGLRS